MRILIPLFVGLATLCCALETMGSDKDAKVQNGPSSPKRPVADVQRRIYAIQYRSLGWQVDVSLNDIPVLLRSGGGQIPITNFVRNGENLLKIEAKQTGATPPVVLEIAIVSSDSSNPAEILETPINLVVDPQKVGAETKLRLTFRGSAHVMWVWEKAAQVDKLSKDDEQQIMSQIQGIYKSLKDKDLGGYDKITSYTVREIAKFRGVAEEQVRQEQHVFFRRSFSDPSYKVLMADRGEIVVKPHGKVASVQRGSGAIGSGVIRIELASQKGATRSLTFRQFLFCKVEGKWRLIN